MIGTLLGRRTRQVQHGTAQNRTVASFRVQVLLASPLSNINTSKHHFLASIGPAVGWGPAVPPLSSRRNRRRAFLSFQRQTVKRSHTPSGVLNLAAPPPHIADATTAVFADPSCRYLYHLSRKRLPELEAEGRRRHRSLENLAGPPRFGRQQLPPVLPGPAPGLAAIGTSCGGGRRRGRGGLLGCTVSCRWGRVPSCQVGVLVGVGERVPGGGGPRKRYVGAHVEAAGVVRKELSFVMLGSGCFKCPPSP